MTGRITIERLGHRGDGIAPGPVYVQRTLPGEVVEGEISGDRMEAPGIVTPSQDRVSPPCRHFRSCGGCAVQHASDAFVANWKQVVVRTALKGQGLEAPFRPMHTSPARSRRRAVYSGRRTKKGALVGFHGRASGIIVEIPDCQLVDPALAACLPALSDLTQAGGSRKAEMSFTVTLAQEGADIAVDGGKPLDMDLRGRIAQLADAAGAVRLAWDGEVVYQRHPPSVLFDGIAVSPPPGVFLQATADGEAALRQAVTEAIGPAARVADLFAGCGTFALPMARQAEVHAIEGSRVMTDALEKGWRHASGLRAVTVEARDLFRRPLDPAELSRFDAVVIDPPRAGAEAQMRQIAASEVPVVAAVSCNPVTFARDASILVAAGFVLEWVQVVDQFRWSTHVELAARLRRGHIAG